MDNRPEEAARPFGDRIVERLGQGVVVVDRCGRVLLANPAARALLRLDEDPCGREIGVLLRATAPGLAAALERPTPAGWEVVVVAIAGETRAFGVTRTPLAGDGSPEAPDAVILSFTDLTRARVAESGARRVATLAGLGRFTRHLAHELKNPIGALKLYALLLQRQLQDAQPKERELLEKIARSVDHLSRVASEVTAWGVPASLERTSFAPAGVLEECLAAVAERAESLGVRVVRRYEDGATAPVDPRALRQACLALVENALEAMPFGGTLTVSCGRSASGEAPGVEIVVRDTGTGMSEEVQARLDEPFFTTKADGTGLGMTIASHVIGLHGGHLEVRSRPGGGAAVRVVLPAA